jgi:hypothetical protein
MKKQPTVSVRLPKNFGGASLHPRAFLADFRTILTSSFWLSFWLPFYSPPNFPELSRQHRWRSAYSISMYRVMELACQEESDRDERKN